jgi:hypothetical protein
VKKGQRRYLEDEGADCESEECHSFRTRRPKMPEPRMHHSPKRGAQCKAKSIHITANVMGDCISLDGQGQSSLSSRFWQEEKVRMQSSIQVLRCASTIVTPV